MTTYAGNSIDDLVLTGQSAADYDDETLAPGTYVMEVESIEKKQMPDFNDRTKMVDKLRFNFVVAEGDWEGFHADALIPLPKNIAHEKAKLGAWWKVFTGEQPVSGGNYTIRSLIGKRCMAAVDNRLGNDRAFANVTSISPLAPPAPARRRPAAPVAPSAPQSLHRQPGFDGDDTIDDDDRDLANA